MACGLPQIKWTDELVSALRDALADGMSSGRAAKHLSERFGVEIRRNMVIGKAMRMGFALAGKPSLCLPNPTQQPKQPKARYRPMERKAPMIEDTGPIEKPESLGLTVTELNDHYCHWTDDDRDFRFCGAPVSEQNQSRGRPWCDHHAQIVFRRQNETPPGVATGRR